MRCPHLHVGARAVPAFRAFGASGMVAGTGLCMTLAPRHGLSRSVVVALAAGVVAAFVLLALATKVVTGRETLTFYHHALVTMAFAGVFVAALGHPVLPYLDLVAVGVAAFLTLGRVGCLWVGCCHGRPGYRGVRYSTTHAQEGFPDYLVGVHLFPVQAVEAAVMAVITLVAAAAWLGRPSLAPGAILAGVALASAVARFVLEFLRGDAERGFALGFSQAQWISLAVVVGITVAALGGAVPWSPALLLASAGLGTAFAVIGLSRRMRSPRLDLLLRPRHVRELAEVADTALVLATTGGRAAGDLDLPVNFIPIGSTTLGVRVSAGLADAASGAAVHYAFSQVDGELHERAALALGDLILRIRHDRGHCQMLKGDHGVYHLVVLPDGG